MTDVKLITKETKKDHCEQCSNFTDLMRFSNIEKFRCEYCMQTEGLCQNCGEYIPFPDDNQESNFAPYYCDQCKTKMLNE